MYLWTTERLGQHIRDLEARVVELEAEGRRMQTHLNLTLDRLDSTIRQRDEWMGQAGEERDRLAAENERLRGLLREAKSYIGRCRDGWMYDMPEFPKLPESLEEVE